MLPPPPSKGGKLVYAHFKVIPRSPPAGKRVMANDGVGAQVAGDSKQTS